MRNRRRIVRDGWEKYHVETDYGCGFQRNPWLKPFDTFKEAEDYVVIVRDAEYKNSLAPEVIKVYD